MSLEQYIRRLLGDETMIISEPACLFSLEEFGDEK